MNSEKGITLISLVITIIILMILTFSVTVNIDNFANEDRRAKFQSDMRSLKEEIDQYYVREKKLPVINKYTNLSTIESVKNVNDGQDYYVIDLDELLVDLKYGKDYETVKTMPQNENISNLLDVYIINGQSHTIYYPKGIEYSEETHYTVWNEFSDVKDKLYTIVPYIESTGTQYIDTGIVPNQDTSIEFIASPKYTSGSEGWFGGRNSEFSNTLCFWKNEQYFRTDYRNQSIDIDDIEIQRDKIYKIYIQKNNTYIDDELYVEFPYNSFQSSSTLTLYGIKTYDRNESYNEVNSVDNRMAKIKFYSCKIWDYHELIRDFIPVISNEQGKNFIIITDQVIFPYQKIKKTIKFLEKNTCIII